mgnify:CR=1 FL=1
MKKRMLLLSLCLLMVISLSSIVGAQEFDWRQYEGESIRVFLPNILWTTRISEQIHEFEELTGIGVEYDVIAEGAYRTSLPVELTARSNDFDVMGSMSVVEGQMFAQAGWYEPLDPFIQDTAQTHSDWDLDDFPEGVKRAAMEVNGTTVVVPWEAQTLLFFYRKDLFEKHNLSVPTTFEELEDVVSKLHNPDERVYGISLRGAGLQTTTPFSAMLYGMGGSWLDENRKPALNTPEAIEAMELYARLASNYGPPGLVSNSWIQTGEIFGQGNAATLIDINIFVPTFENPETSAVAGKVGYAVVPAGPAGSQPFISGWGFAVNPFSSNKGPAWYFIQWATSKEMQKQAALTGQPVPRISAQQHMDAPDDLREALSISYEIAHPFMNPNVTAASQARDIVGEAIIRAIQGESVPRLASEANTKLIELMEMTER